MVHEAVFSDNCFVVMWWKKKTKMAFKN